MSLTPYSKVGWQDNVVDEQTGETIQEGTPLSQNNLNHMDDGIAAANANSISHDAQITTLQSEVKVLKDATLNNITNNVFVENFEDVSSVDITSGIYDAAAHKIYV
ncbi:MAG TPA: inorganic polyphosphate kinase [Ruminiclostridium sp.]|nr:inorganic polyphosphate kinase [Ruminiclostridium sp.]